jgi:hypothetical protein
MHAGTDSGLAMHFTSTGMWGARSGFARVVHKDVADFIAAVATYPAQYYERSDMSDKSTYFLFRVVHGSLYFW